MLQQEETVNISTAGRSSRSSRLKWTNKMNSDLLECKRKAKERATSENPPRNLNGRKIGYMNIMKELWENACKNLRDQASRLEKTIGNLWDTMLRNINRENEELQSENIRDIGTGNEEAQLNDCS